jgi:hypothetical protein
MTVKSRFGSYLRGRYFIYALWNNIKSPSSVVTSGYSDITTFDYGQAQGQYDLTSTTQFPHTKYVPPVYNLGFTPSLLNVSGQLDAWTQQTVDISGYAGATVQLVFHYVNTGGAYTSDMQLDQIDLDGNIYSFENTTHNFETSVTGDNQSVYANVTWEPVAIQQDSRSQWQVDSGGTPSGGTGRTDAAAGTWYIYTEMSGEGATVNFNTWLRSPQVTLSSNPTLTFFEARLGASIGSLNIHLDVIA